MVRKKNLNFILYLEECYNKMCGLEIELYETQNELASVEIGIPVTWDCLRCRCFISIWMNNRMNESLGFILLAEEKHNQEHVSVEMN